MKGGKACLLVPDPIAECLGLCQCEYRVIVPDHWQQPFSVEFFGDNRSDFDVEPLIQYGRLFVEIVVRDTIRDEHYDLNSNLLDSF
jgi:hypothetical protein